MTYRRLFQVYSRDDITIDHLVEENCEHAANRLDLRGSTTGQYWPPEQCIFPLSERYEFEGGRYTTRHIISTIVETNGYLQYMDMASACILRAAMLRPRPLKRVLIPWLYICITTRICDWGMTGSESSGRTMIARKHLNCRYVIAKAVIAVGLR